MQLPYNVQQEVDASLKQFANGATRGMVDKHLRTAGLNESEREQVITYAWRVHLNRRRFKGLVNLVAGGVLTALGGTLYYFLSVDGILPVEIPSAVILFGLILAGFGAYRIVLP